MLRNGRPAPDFTLKDADGNERLLTELRRGKPLLLYFYRFSGCPTARRDLAAYAEAYPRITAFGAEMVAINVEFQDAHRALRESLSLPYLLLSDAGFRISERYGVYRSDDKEGPQPHGEPAVFIVDVDGNMAYSQVQTGPKGSATPDAMALVLYYMSQNGGRY
jgi:peroxiredoxin Q/BCP